MPKGVVLHEETVCTLGFEGRVYKVTVKRVPGYILEDSVRHNIYGNNQFVCIVDLSTHQTLEGKEAYRVWSAYLDRDFAVQTLPTQSR